MIKLSKFPDEEWYLDRVKHLFVNGNTSEKNFENSYKSNSQIINKELEKIINTDIFENNKNSNFTLLEKLIMADFNELNKIYKNVEPKWQEIFFDKSTNEKDGEVLIMKLEWEKFHNLYDKFIRNKLNTELIKRYGVKCCPYCNENYIFNRQNHATAQLDHFYPRSKYPIFAISLYNLVPACTPCNHIKKDNLVAISPHNHSYDYDNLKISYIPNSSEWITNPNELNIDFQYNKINEFSKGMDLNKEILALGDAYNMHTDYVQEILKKAQIYNTEARVCLQNDFPGLFNSEEEILRVIFGNYINEYELLQRPLSKLTRDILQELHII